ncbi:uncharacterized protein DDB_G0271670 isoform X2 [Stomoxys calcitrans]|uniref:uncharacterized protein DDB_G0271670 isoform X2 n=1 Tax=Stomoxys calcitrans TaxID=35570 RepID=UPI0027E26E89|nr:uncharacterized protein DDB_G0271670 isoform X2 [Stomoxys calcitrans]
MMSMMMFYVNKSSFKSNITSTSTSSCSSSSSSSGGSINNPKSGQVAQPQHSIHISFKSQNKIAPKCSEDAALINSNILGEENLEDTRHKPTMEQQQPHRWSSRNHNNSLELSHPLAYCKSRFCRCSYQGSCCQCCCCCWDNSSGGRELKQLPEKRTISGIDNGEKAQSPIATNCGKSSNIKEKQSIQRLAQRNADDCLSSSSTSNNPNNCCCHNNSSTNLTTTISSITSLRTREYDKTTTATKTRSRTWTWPTRPANTLNGHESSGGIKDDPTTTTTTTNSNPEKTLRPLGLSLSQSHSKPAESTTRTKSKLYHPYHTAERQLKPAAAAAASTAIATASCLYNNIIRHLGLQLCCLLLLRLTMMTTGLAVGMDTANANLTDLGSPGMYKSHNIKTIC